MDAYNTTVLLDSLDDMNENLDRIVKCLKEVFLMIEIMIFVVVMAIICLLYDMVGGLKNAKSNMTKNF